MSAINFPHGTRASDGPECSGATERTLTNPSAMPCDATTKSDRRAHASALTDEIETYARPALAVNDGLDDVAMSSPIMLHGQLSSVHLEQAARAHRAGGVARIFAAALRSLSEVVGRAYAAWRRRGHAHGTYLVLRELDDRTLRDLGFHRSELRSVAAELAGEANRTRVRVSDTLPPSI